jgi:threonine synthase
MSFLHDLACAECGTVVDARQAQSYCPVCPAPFKARYDLDAARRQVDRDALPDRGRGMWRWRELLPVVDPGCVITLGEGDSPLLRLNRLGANWGLAELWLKDEGVNPTGSFKARGISAALSRARELGIRRVIIPTAGNAGGALAAYAARGGLTAEVIMPRDAPAANIAECRAAGAAVTLVDGLISDAGKLAAARAREGGWFDVSTFKEPYRLEGKKVMGYELAQAFGWRLPDVIVYPTGGGTGLVGMWKAFAELNTMGWLEEPGLPRLVSVQATGCAPVVRAFEQGKEACTFWEGAATLASGLRVPRSFADRMILRDLRDSRGTAIAVTDEAILEAQRELGATEGIFAAPEGAATLVAVRRLAGQGWIHPGEEVVVFNTGSGLKYL